MAPPQVEARCSYRLELGLGGALCVLCVAVTLLRGFGSLSLQQKGVLANVVLDVLVTGRKGGNAS